MSHRQSTDASGAVQYPPGVSALPNVKGVYYNQNYSSKVVAFNGHTVEVYADGAVWDTVSNAYLYPGKDFNVVP
jgi:hypothetical protein